MYRKDERKKKLPLRSCLAASKGLKSRAVKTSGKLLAGLTSRSSLEERLGGGAEWVWSMV